MLEDGTLPERLAWTLVDKAGSQVSRDQLSDHNAHSAKKCEKDCNDEAQATVVVVAAAIGSSGCGCGGGNGSGGHVPPKERGTVVVVVVLNSSGGSGGRCGSGGDDIEAQGL